MGYGIPSREMPAGDSMKKVRIQIGCPSGTTEDWTKSTEILIPEEFLYLLGTKVIGYAEMKGRDYRGMVE